MRLEDVLATAHVGKPGEGEVRVGLQLGRQRAEAGSGQVPDVPFRRSALLDVGPAVAACGRCGTSNACQSTGAAGGVTALSLEQPDDRPARAQQGPRIDRLDIQHDRVGVVGLIMAGAQDVLLVRGQSGPAVIAVDQDVQRVGAVHRRPVAEGGRRHRDAGDAVVNGTVLQVRGQRARGHDDDRRDGNPAEHVPLAASRLRPHA